MKNGPNENKKIKTNSDWLGSLMRALRQYVACYKLFCYVNLATLDKHVTPRTI